MGCPIKKSWTLTLNIMNKRHYKLSPEALNHFNRIYDPDSYFNPRPVWIDDARSIMEPPKEKEFELLGNYDNDELFGHYDE